MAWGIAAAMGISTSAWAVLAVGLALAVVVFVMERTRR
jgi:hypothetical protein